MKLMSKKRDETPVELTIRHVRVLEYGDAQYTQLFNILIRQTLRALDLKLLGRNYFDPAAKVMHFFSVKSVGIYLTLAIFKHVESRDRASVAWWSGCSSGKHEGVGSISDKGMKFFPHLCEKVTKVMELTMVFVYPIH